MDKDLLLFAALKFFLDELFRANYTMADDYWGYYPYAYIGERGERKTLAAAVREMLNTQNNGQPLLSEQQKEVLLKRYGLNGLPPDAIGTDALSAKDALTLLRDYPQALAVIAPFQIPGPEKWHELNQRLKVLLHSVSNRGLPED